MDDLISRQAAIDAITKVARKNFNLSDEYGQYLAGLSDAETEIRRLPSAEWRGKWIYPTDIIGFGRCGNCKALWDIGLIRNKFFRYCPRCGAEMEEDT